MCFKGMREINVKHNDDGTVTALVRFGSDEALNAWLHAAYAIQDYVYTIGSLSQDENDEKPKEMA